MAACPAVDGGRLAGGAATGYAFGPTPREGAHADVAGLAEVHERASGDFGGHVVLGLGLLLGLLAVIALRALVMRARRRDSRRLGAGCFFLLPLLAYSSQELIERLLHAESVPFDAAPSRVSCSVSPCRFRSPPLRSCSAGCWFALARG